MLRTVALRLTFFWERGRQRIRRSCCHFFLRRRRHCRLFVCRAKKKGGKTIFARMRDSFLFLFPCFGTRMSVLAVAIFVALSLLRGFGLSEEGRKEEWPGEGGEKPMRGGVASCSEGKSGRKHRQGYKKLKERSPCVF